jgi:DNA-binding IclR family transcriptional regulator
MSIQSVQRALKILQLFTPEQPLMGITEISIAMNLHKATAQGLVETLAKENFLEQEPKTRRYKLSLKFYELGTTVMNNLDINRRASTIIPDLAKRTNFVVRVGILDGDSVIVTMDAYPRSEPYLSRQYGPRAPLYCTALGKAILASMNRKEINAYLKRTKLIPYTAKTITQKDALLKELNETRKRGYAINREEFLFARAAIGAPILLRNEHQLAAITVVGEPKKILSDNIQELAHTLILAASEISGNVGSLPKPFLPTFT